MKIALLNILFGIVLAAVGIAVSVGSYAMVSRSGGHYVVAWGAVAVGAWRVIVGVYQLVRASFTSEGRASIGHLLWPRSAGGWLLRVAILLVAGVAVWVVGPESWTTVSPAPLQTYQARDEIKSIAYSPDGKWIALALNYGGLSIIDARTGTAGKSPLLPAYSAIEAVAFSPDGTTLATVAFGGLQIWKSPDWGRQSPSLFMSEKKGDYGVAFSPDGATVATGSISAGLMVWDVQSRTLKWQSNSGRSVHGVAFSRDGRTIASGDEYGGLQLLDAATGKLEKTFSVGDFSYGPVRTIAFLKDGRVAAANYRQQAVDLWDARSGTKLRSFRPTSRLRGGGIVWSIGVAPDDGWIAGGEADGSLRFWDMKNDNPIRTIFGHRKDVLSVAVSPDGSRVATGGTDKALMIYASP